jgi:F-type H+-transporting ATPase subunit gamma
VASPREIRRRIRSIGSTAQITKAMQMVAASKMRKAQQAAIEVRPFVHLFYRLQRVITTKAVAFSHPLLEARDVRTRGVILVASDKGLCGSLNTNLFRIAADFDPTSTLFIAAGRKTAQFLARTRRRLVAEFPYGDTPRFTESRAIAAVARDLFLTHEVDSVQVIAARFVNTLVQEPVVLDLLPIGDIGGIKVPGVPSTQEIASDPRQFLYEPSTEDLVTHLVEYYLNIAIHLVLLNAKASEQSARMVSMKNATENATAMIRELTIEYNKLRQGRITQELLEIAGGQAQ